MGSENVNLTRSYNFSFYWLTDLCFALKSGIFLEAGDEEWIWRMFVRNTINKLHKSLLQKLFKNSFFMHKIYLCQAFMHLWINKVRGIQILTITLFR
jgi:hypothetical protein